MKKKIFFFIGILVIGLITFGSASRAFAQDLIATMVRQTIEAMITPTPTVSIKDIKIGVFVNQTVEAYYTGTPTPLPTLTSTLTATPDREATIAAMVETASALTLTPAGISSPEGLPIRSGRPIGITLLLVGLGVFSAVGAGLIGYGLKRRR